MQEKQEKSFLAKKYAWPIVLASAFCAYIIDTVFHNGFSGILFFTLNLAAVIIGFWLWQEKNNQSETPNSKLPLAWLFLTLTLSVWLFVRDSAWLYTFNFMTALILGMLFWINTQKKSLATLEINFLLPFSFLFTIFIKITTPLKSIWGNLNIFNGKKSKIVFGTLLALPIITLICALLYSADLVFQKYFDDFFKLFDFSWFSDWFSHIFIIAYFFIFSGTYYSLIRTRKNFTNPEIIVKEKDKIVLQIISILIAVVLLVFSWIQLKYLFFDSSALEKLGIGYQQYAHQGFYQLMIVAVIVFSIIWLLGKEKINNVIDTRLNKLNLAISFVLIAEIIFILISAMKRLWLFIDTLQWATKRFFAFEGMVFFIILLILFSLHLVINKITRQHFLYAITILFSINLLFLNIINVDKYIAEKNVNKYINERGEEWEMDFDYTAYVSADAAAQGLNLFDNARTDKEKIRAAYSLDDGWRWLENYKERQNKHFYIYNISKESAYQLLSPRASEIQKYINNNYDKFENF